jgi:uncharacterized protein YdaL
MSFGRSKREPLRRGLVRWIPVVVVAAVVLSVAIPSLLGSGKPALRPLRLSAVAAPAPRIPAGQTWPAEASHARSTLVLYDTGGRWGWLGELYATMTVNLASHFGNASAEPAARYRRGQVERHSALIYIGSTYGQRLPAGLLADVVHTRRPVLWVNDNIWQLERATPDFERRYGFETGAFDRSAVARVLYKRTALTRSALNTGGIMSYAALDRARVQILAKAVRANSTTFPWALRSRNLIYVGEIPFAYASESDRVLVFDDLLFDLLAPRTRERHRALVRLEDINPTSDPQELRAAADFLHSRGIPFGFGVSPRYRDPWGRQNGGEREDVLLHDAPSVVAAIKYLERKGGVLVDHGYTHQWDGGVNPYTGATGDDVEFYRVSESPTHGIRYDGPLRDDTPGWADRRIVYAIREFAAAGIARPRIFEFPHYIASPRDYRAVAHRFAVRWERGVYFSGVLTGRPVDYRHYVGQIFPYVVRDVYGSKVLPENLGAITPHRWHQYPPRLPRDLIAAARANLVVRDGFASFFFHPFLDLRYLRESIAGIQALGYTFVSPAHL